MKFLLDMPILPYLVPWLNDQGHDAVHASSLKLDQAADWELLSYAAREQRVVITADTDFPQLIALSQQYIPGVVLFRGGNYSRQEMQELLNHVIQTMSEESLHNSVSTVDRKRIRQRRLPLI